jgi:transcriptional regulator with XRE-family HTH domain
LTPVVNERLRAAITAAGLTLEKVAEHVGVDAKTVGRWIADADRVPHRTHRAAAATLLGVAEVYLWPAIAADPRTAAASTAELVAFYPTRSAVPGDLWRSLIADAREKLDVLVMAGLFLPEQQDVQLLAARAAAGVRVRLLLGDPCGDAVLLRGREENFGIGLAHRVSLALRYYENVLDVPGLELRLHNTTLYNSLFRSDDTLLINAHIYGSPAGQNPVLHLRRVAGGQTVARYLDGFDKVWVASEQVTDVHAVIKKFEERI